MTFVEDAGKIVSADEGLSLNSSRGRIALVATVAGSGMASLDATVVNVALPRIGEDLDASISSLQWVLTGYLLALASLILLGGALGRSLRPAEGVRGGTVWFAAASLLCGAAPNVEVLVAARSCKVSALRCSRPAAWRSCKRAFGRAIEPEQSGHGRAWAVCVGAIGPFVGGWLVDGPGWRWAFLINIPVAVIVVVCARSAVPETRDPHAAPESRPRGAALGVVSLGAATWALTEAGPKGGRTAACSPQAPWPRRDTSFVHRMMHTRNPLVPPSLFRSRGFTVTNVATVLLYASIGVTFFLVAYELQVVSGWSALRAGTALLPTTILMLVFRPSPGTGAADRTSSAADRRTGPRGGRAAPPRPHRVRRVMGDRRAARDQSCSASAS